MLSEQLKRTIKEQSEDYAVHFKHGGDYRIYGYIDGATPYAEKWQEAEQRTATMAEVIEELMNIAYPNVTVLKRANQILADYNTHKQALTPKTSTDDPDNE